MLDKLRQEAQMANLLGAVFIAVAILGFLPNPIVSPTGIFAVNTAHNLVHALSGVLLLIGAAIKHGKQALLLIAVIYIVVAVLGFLMPGDMMMGMVQMNEADRWLHVLLAGVISAAAVWVRPTRK